MEWLGFLGSIIGGIIGGLFTYLGVKLTLRHDDDVKRKDEIKKAIEERPRLEITNFKEIKNARIISKSDLNALVLHIEKIDFDKNERIYFSYDERAMNNDNLLYIEYKLQNIGLTEIEDLCLVCNLTKDTAILDFGNKDTDINEKFLNYTVWTEKRNIKPNDFITIKIYYLKNKIIRGSLSASCSIYMRDINGRYWHQPLFAPENETGTSTLVSYQIFREASTIESAIKCFRGKEPW